jgi:hypothetical protein
MYGRGMDSAGYLRRFFDFNIKIPQGDIKNYVRHVLEPMISRSGFQQYDVDIMINMYTKLNLSLRDINKITNNFMVFYLYYKHILSEKSGSVISNSVELYLYFMILKYKYPETYDLILRKDYIAYDNSPKNWPVLEFKYFVSTYISEVLKAMQTGAGRQKNKELISKYAIININSEDSLAEHIEKTIEMFS